MARDPESHLRFGACGRAAGSRPLHYRGQDGRRYTPAPHGKHIQTSRFALPIWWEYQDRPSGSASGKLDGAEESGVARGRGIEELNVARRVRQCRQSFPGSEIRGNLNPDHSIGHTRKVESETRRVFNRLGKAQVVSARKSREILIDDAGVVDGHLQRRW